MSRTGPLGTDALRVTDPPHPVYERVFRCTDGSKCGGKVTKTGPFFEHLTAETFVCGWCATGWGSPEDLAGLTRPGRALPTVSDVGVAA